MMHHLLLPLSFASGQQSVKRPTAQSIYQCIHAANTTKVAIRGQPWAWMSTLHDVLFTSLFYSGAEWWMNACHGFLITQLQCFGWYAYRAVNFCCPLLCLFLLSSSLECPGS